MKRWTTTLLVMGLLASSAHATTIDDFRRSTSVTLTSASAQLHITGPLTDEEKTSSSGGTLCMTKPAGSLDVDVNLSALGLPLTLHFSGTAPQPNHVRLAVDQLVNQCLSLPGGSAEVERVRGVLTLRLYGLADPFPAQCGGGEHSQTFAVNGGGEGDPDNYLIIDADPLCSGIFSGKAVVHDIRLRGESGAPPPDLPVLISSFTSEQTFICPPPNKDVVIPGELRLQNPAPSGGAVFSLHSSDPQVLTWPPAVTIARGYSGATFTTRIPKGLTGDFVITAQGPQGALGQHVISVTYDPLCRVVHHLPRPVSTCLPCLYGAKMRAGKPAGIIGVSSGGDVLYSSAPVELGAAGYGTSNGRSMGYARVGLSTVEFPDTRLLDMNALGVAVGADVRAVTPTPVRALAAGQLEELDSLSGVGEARFVDDDGNAVGWVADALGARHAALWVDRALTLFELPRTAVSSEAVSLADDGTVVVTYRTAAGGTGSLLFNLADRGPRSFREVDVPAGWTGVELVGANTSGVAGHLIGFHGEREPFLDFGAGVQLVRNLLDPGVDVTELKGLGPANELIARGVLDGTPQDFVLRGEGKAP
jgi:hypothetical protein